MKTHHKCMLSVAGGIVAGVLLTLAYQKWGPKPAKSGYTALSMQK